ncbi:phosphoinositide 3-kinase regulatory subunit 6 isoform X1 [Hemibagrus wyckioides]|uniref:phosphoinositide 3-kinase regulatory subunit 6 isoform X1 n=1 Tax=Hemibagrus wyckioides TaxID=337641 RepID=UPI00266B6D5C|nr:phosphoinositide 3-kinase regulatory subunit 6 isoform X1 [Hemibagrus wyckioides]
MNGSESECWKPFELQYDSFLSCYVELRLSVRTLMEKTAGKVSSDVESSLYQRVHAMLRELDTHAQAVSTCNKGMLRWTLHKKVENNPSISISLLRVLIKELEKAERTDCKIRIIPLLHTLAYAVIQSAYIPDELCERIYACLKRLVTLPEPYCSVGLNYAKQMRIEHNIPGALYQRRVIAEHSLKNDHYPLHERVFVFADPAMFPETTLNALRADVECGALDWATLTPQRRVLLHTLQAGLGRECHGRQLTQALEDLGEDIEKYFQDVVSIVEERIVDGGSECDLYSERLQQLYDEIICSSSTEQSCPASLVGTPLPSPEVSFHVWTKEDEIWNEVINFTLMLGSTNQTSAFLEDDQDSRRASVISTISRDSGIEGDLPLNEFSFLMVEPSGGPEVQEQQKSFSRRPCVRWPKAANRMTLMMEAIKESGGTGGSGSYIVKEEKNFTARAVVMGDDSTLGRLAKAYHNIRKKEMRNLFLTKRVNLEIYYIPVTTQSNTASPVQENATANVDRLTLAASLGSVDPWYDSNINSLGAMMLKLAETHTSVVGSSEPNSFLLDIISYYTRTAQQPVHIPIYSVKLSFSGLESKVVEDLFVCQLDMDFPGFKPVRLTFKDTIRGSVRYKKTMQEECGVVVAVNYRKASISNREVDKRMPLTISGVSIRAAPPSGTKSLESLSVYFRDPNPTRPPVPTLRVTNICIRALEQKTFTVRLDKDSCRTFKNVQSIEVSPCTDPGYSLQKSKSKHSLTEDDSGLSKFLSKTFSLPINTFSGAV